MGASGFALLTKAEKYDIIRKKEKTLDMAGDRRTDMIDMTLL